MPLPSARARGTAARTRDAAGRGAPRQSPRRGTGASEARYWTAGRFLSRRTARREASTERAARQQAAAE